ncbi:hypothetical protein [Sinomonas atrocyanea]|uniref:hypothetical protein n=1 Tax=Sinomonas atrocyanea TaxID=37927 RepID=UPI003D95CC87
MNDDEQPPRRWRGMWREALLGVLGAALLIGAGIWLLVFVAGTCAGVGNVR